jgi:hypothetical protein
MEKVKEKRRAPRPNTYALSSLHEGDGTCNVDLESARKMDTEAARQKARRMKGGGGADFGEASFAFLQFRAALVVRVENSHMAPPQRPGWSHLLPRRSSMAEVIRGMRMGRM